MTNYILYIILLFAVAFVLYLITRKKKDTRQREFSEAQKKEILKRIIKLDKPFILLLPASCITTLYFKDLFKDKQIQIIIPKKRIQFELNGKQTKRSNFDCFYYCYKMGLDKDITFTF